MDVNVIVNGMLEGGHNTPTRRSSLAEEIVNSFLHDGFQPLHWRWIMETPERLAFLKDKYKGVPENVFNGIVAADPTTVVKDNQIVKVGGYTQWLLTQYEKATPASKSRFIEDLYKANDDLGVYNKLKSRLPQEQRDINRIKSLEDLTAAVEPLRGQKTAGEQKKEVKGDAIKVMNTTEWTVVIPKTKEASCSYGAGTRWCTASDKYNYFEQYSKDGPLYIVIHHTTGVADHGEPPFQDQPTPHGEKKPMDEKWQFHFQSNQFMDEADSGIDIKEFFEEHPEVGKAIAKYAEDQLSAGLAGEGYPRSSEATKQQRDTFLYWMGTISKADPSRAAPLALEGVKNYGLPVDYLPPRALIELIRSGELEVEKVNSQLNGDMQRGAPSDVQFAKEGVWYVFGDWEKVSKFFGDSRDVDHAKTFERMASGDDYDMFDSGYATPIKDVWDNIDEKNMQSIQAIMREKIDDDNDPSGRWNDDEELQTLASEDAEVRSAIERAAEEANSDATRSAYWNGYVKEFESTFGKTQYIKAGGEDVLASFQSFGNFVQDVEAAMGDRDVDYDEPGEDRYPYRDLLDGIHNSMSNAGELLMPSGGRYGEFYGDSNDEVFNERLGEHIHELMPKVPRTHLLGKPAKPTV